METINKRNHNFLTRLLVGGVLGGVAALLLAPKSGKELRDNIQQTGEEVIHGTKAFFGKAGRQLTEARQRAKEILSGEEGEGTEASRSQKPES